MKKLAIYCLVLLMLPLAGCPLRTMIPVDDGSADVQPWLRGRWREVTELSRPAAEWFIERDLRKGNLTIYEADSERKVNYGFAHHAILSSLDGRTYVSLNNDDPDGTDEGYYIYELRKVNKDEIVLEGIKANKLPYSASVFELRNLLRVNKNNSAIFDPHECIVLRRSYAPSTKPFD